MNMSNNPCRLCLDCISDKVDIFSSECGDKHLPKMILKLFSIKIKSTDKLSRVVCTDCISLVKKFHNFSNRVRHAQKKISRVNYNSVDFKHVNSPVHLRKRKTFCNESQMIFEETDSNYISHCVKKEQIEAFSTDFDNIERSNCPLSNNSSIKLNDCYKTTQNVKPDLDNLIISTNGHFISDNPICFQGTDQVLALNLNENCCNTEPLVDKDLEEEYISETQLHHSKDERDLTSFPSEVYKNGKLILKGSILDDVVKRFYNLHCDICSDKPQFKILSDLFKHIETFHGTKGYVTCCDSRLYQRRTIHMHMARHLQPSAFECPICKKPVSRPNTLKLHLQTHLPDSEKPYKCDQCDKRYSGMNGLTSHKLTHIPITERTSYECKLCSKTFTLSKYYTGHMANVHAKDKFLCSECGRSFQTKINLNLHMMTHDPTGINKAQCQHCGFLCKSKQSLQRHIKRHTSEPLQCDKCHFNTHLKQQLNIHMRVKHSDHKPFVCFLCGKQFKLKNVLNAHMVQHTGEKKFSCLFCTKTFASSGNYYTHRKRMHSHQYTNNPTIKSQNILRLKDKTESKDILQSDIHELAREQLKHLEILK